MLTTAADILVNRCGMGGLAAAVVRAVEGGVSDTETDAGGVGVPTVSADREPSGAWCWHLPCAGMETKWLGEGIV